MRRAARLTLMALVSFSCCGRTSLLVDAELGGGAPTGSVASNGTSAANHMTGATAATEASGAPVTSGATDTSGVTAATEGTGGKSVGSSAGSTGGGCGLPWLLFSLPGPVRSPLYAMRSDGSDPHVVKLAHASPSYVSISSDGTKVAYVVYNYGPDGGFAGETLFLEKLGSGVATAVVSSPDIPPDPTDTISYSALSGDGKTVAYTLGYAIHVIDADGKNDRDAIDPGDNGGVYGHPLFVGDTTTFLYGLEEAFGSARTDGSRSVTLVTNASVQFPNPAISPDLASVAAVVECASDTEPWLRVYAYASLPAACESGTKVAKTTGNSAEMNGSANPSWGPTNSIAYADGRDIYVVDPAGGVPRNMTAAMTGSMTGALDPLWAPSCAPIP